jgi:hypothetical protein
MNKTKVFLSIEAYQKMRLWVDMAKGEISWLEVYLKSETRMDYSKRS